MSEGKLTPRQAKFVAEYLVDTNATQAAIRAGSAPAGAHVWASRTLRNPKVSAELKKRLEADSERLRVSRENVVSMLLASFQMAKEQGEPAAMVSAARELGRMMGFYAPTPARFEVDLVSAAEKGRLDAMTDAELLRLIGSNSPAQPRH